MVRKFWQTYWGYLLCSLLCSLLGHVRPVTLIEEDNEDCDCGADHTYTGCPRCRVATG